MKEICPACSAKQRSGASFCRKCGRRLRSPEPDDVGPRSARTSFRLLWLALGSYFVLLIVNLGSFLGKIDLAALRSLDIALVFLALGAMQLASRSGPIPSLASFATIPKLSLKLLGQILFGVLAALAAATLLGLIAPLVDKDLMQLYRAQGQSMRAAVLDLCVVAPFLEETVFRGIVLGALLPLLTRRGALWTSSLMFAALHLTPLTFVHHTLLGYICGHARLQTKSMLVPVVIHSAYNAIIVSLAW